MQVNNFGHVGKQTIVVDGKVVNVDGRTVDPDEDQERHPDVENKKTK